MSSLLHFIARLFDDGRPAVPTDVNISTEDRREVQTWLMEFDRAWRRDLPGQAPRFDADAAIWGAEKLFQACHLLTYRAAGPELIAARFSSAAPPLADNADTHYSVDLTARFVPDVIRLARAAAADDPLIYALCDWVAWWPLSSTGLEKFRPERIAAIIGHPSLLKMYVDRILLTQDASRLADPAVRAAVRNAVGAQRTTAGKLQQELFSDAERDEPL